MAPLYFAQGLPYGVVMLMAPIFFTAKGLSLESIGLASILGLPWTLKLLWSPLADLWGKRRDWVTVTLFALFGAIALLAVICEFQAGAATSDGQHMLMLAVAASLLVISLISATADLSQDAYYMDVLDKRQQALFVGPRVTAYRIAMITAQGGLVFIAGKISWTLAFGLAALMMGMLAFWGKAKLPHTDLRPPESESAADFFRKFGRAFKSYVQRDKPIVVLLFIVTYKLGEQLLGRMATPFLMNECGISPAGMGVITGVFGVGATIIGALAASYWIARSGLWSAMIAITLFMNSTDLLYVGLAYMEKPVIELVTIVHVVENFSLGLGTSAFAYLLIRTCSNSYRAAHYAIATGLMGFVGTAAGSVSGFVAAEIGYGPFFMLCLVASVPGIVLLFMLPRELTGRGNVNSEGIN